RIGWIGGRRGGGDAGVGGRWGGGGRHGRVGRGQERGGGVPGSAVAGIDRDQFLQRRAGGRRGLGIGIGGRLGGEERLDLGWVGCRDDRSIDGSLLLISVVRRFPRQSIFLPPSALPPRPPSH